MILTCPVRWLPASLLEDGRRRGKTLSSLLAIVPLGARVVDLVAVPKCRLHRPRRSAATGTGAAFGIEAAPDATATAAPIRCSPTLKRYLHVRSRSWRRSGWPVVRRDDAEAVGDA